MALGRRDRGRGAKRAAGTAVVLAIAAGTASAARFEDISLNKFGVYYGSTWDQSRLDAWIGYDVVVDVAYLKSKGVKYVIGYISIGEQSNVYNPDRITTTPSGPRTWNNVTKQVEYTNQGYATYYMDYLWDDNRKSYVQDNQPDMNTNWHSAFIYPDDSWRQILKNQRKTHPWDCGQGVAGIDQLLGERTNDASTDLRDNYGFDGLFLDTLDTAGVFEKVWGYYPFAGQEMANTVKFIRDLYPNKKILANRGVFFYNPLAQAPMFNYRPYALGVSQHVDGAIFESYFLDSNPTSLVPGQSFFFLDNRCQWTPRLIAESQRGNGFTVFNVDYAMGRTSLYPQSIQEAIVNNGWVGYMSTDGSLAYPNSYYMTNYQDAADTTPPTWLESSLDNMCQFDPKYSGATYTPGTPGIRDVFDDSCGNIVVRYEVAKDTHGPVRYQIAVSANGQFGADTDLFDNVVPDANPEWAKGTKSVPAHQTVLSGQYKSQFFRVRAKDALGNTDTNTVIMQHVPGRAQWVPPPPPELYPYCTQWRAVSCSSSWPADYNNTCGTDYCDKPAPNTAPPLPPALCFSTTTGGAVTSQPTPVTTSAAPTATDSPTTLQTPASSKTSSTTARSTQVDSRIVSATKTTTAAKPTSTLTSTASHDGLEGTSAGSSYDMVYTLTIGLGMVVGGVFFLMAA